MRDKTRNIRKTIGHFPHVAIVVPCYNEARSIASTIRSLLALDYPKNKLEIIVVDDGSTDDTLAIARRFETGPKWERFFDEDLVRSGASPAGGKTFPLRPTVRVYHKENGGKHTAMNLGLARTDAELIGCLDADSVVEENALREIVPIFQNQKVAAVTPGIHVREPKTILQHMQNVEYRLSLFNRFIFAALGSVFITPGPFSIFRTSVIRELGGWRYAHSTEDMEMALRIQSVGLLIGNAPRAVVYTSTPPTIRSLFRQRVRWTYGWLCNMVDYRHMLGNRKFGDLGLVVLPAAIISIIAGIYFFLRIVWYGVHATIDAYTRTQIVGIHPSTSYDLFYLNTSLMVFLVVASVGLILTLICIGSAIGTDSRRPPYSTPLFLIFYSFLTPLWLITAVIRAVFKTGVQWR
ncbi:MAG: glycosyltransferase family 2 protein [bacterium]|nr:glycosyltransferase family 2 protein [bacterium]